MPKKTVLEYVQACLSTMDSDQVDAIDEVAESMQVANLLPDLYYELLNRQEWEFLKGPVTLTASSDIAHPTQFTAPAGLRRLHQVWYNVAEDGTLSRRELKFLEPADFLRRAGGGANKQLVTDGQQLQYYVATDRHPAFWTTFDDVTVVCDAVKTDVESTLVSSKVSAYGVAFPEFQVTDDFVPVLPEHMVPLLQATLNAASHRYFKQQASLVDESREQRQLSQAQKRNSTLASREDYYHNKFGRR